MEETSFWVKLSFAFFSFSDMWARCHSSSHAASAESFLARSFFSCTSLRNGWSRFGPTTMKMFSTSATTGLDGVGNRCFHGILSFRVPT